MEIVAVPDKLKDSAMPVGASHGAARAMVEGT